ncbi:MAG: type II toxin-antitoxin system VapC family toxin [Gemmatimonadales bacterium]
MAERSWIGTVPRGCDIWRTDATIESGFEELPIRLSHAEAIRTLPWHHRDPFDRMLIAQALAERLTLVTRDPQFRRYKVRLLRA